MNAAPDDLDALLASLLTPAAEPVPVLEPEVATTEQPDPETLLEMEAARAWQAGDQVAFDKALARLPVDRAEHHRRMASVCDLIKSRQSERARLKGDDRDRTSPAASVGSP
jgi:hypothetical protein